MRTLLRTRLVTMVAACTVLATLPTAVLAAFGHEHMHLTSRFHFWAVTASALAATLASLALTVVGVRRRDARTTLVGVAFSAMAALLLVHGLASPGVLIEDYEYGLAAVSGAMTLPVGAAVLMLSALPAFRGPRRIGWLLVLQGTLLAAIAGFGAYGLYHPEAIPALPRVASTGAMLLLFAGLGAYGYLALRTLDAFLLTQRLGDAVIVVGVGFLGAALGGALMYEAYELGWWLGHSFELVGIVLVGVPVAVDLHRAAQSHALTGGPSAATLVAAEETFLGSRVRALTVRLSGKDTYTEEHTRRVALLAVQVGEELGLPPSRLRSLATGGLLHDIGKLAVPDGILKKPGPLTEDEFAVIRRHPEWGHHLLGELGDFSPAVRRLVLDHHERLDGSGYPRGLDQAQLDLETRILAVCDVYDALISNRVYRDAWPHERALELLRREAAITFDSNCVAALERVLTREHGRSLDIAV
jgi:HD-GYP domain-containing protein (c-di-GMP phosphodiesterase class II)